VVGKLVDPIRLRKLLRKAQRYHRKPAILLKAVDRLFRYIVERCYKEGLYLDTTPFCKACSIKICCMEGPWVTEEDVEVIVEKTGLPRREFLEEDTSNDEYAALGLIGCLKLKTPCPFFDMAKGICKIHHFKPMPCRASACRDILCLLIRAYGEEALKVIDKMLKPLGKSSSQSL